jgi:hypothetical protein
MLIDRSIRGVAQPGSAPALGAGGRPFKSARPDFAPVAQGKEQRPSKPQVKGSNPFWRALQPGRIRAFIPQRMRKTSAAAPVLFEMVVSVAQHGRAPGCGLGGRGFKSLHSPQVSVPRFVRYDQGR